MTGERHSQISPCDLESQEDDDFNLMILVQSEYDRSIPIEEP